MQSVCQDLTNQHLNMCLSIIEVTDVKNPCQEMSLFTLMTRRKVLGRVKASIK